MISIVMSIYNGHDYLDKCLNSISNQLDQNFELILVDDGSTDDSRHICTNYVEKHDNAYLVAKSNGGLSSARKEGLKYANYDYIVFIDCDDILSKDYIKEFNQVIEKYSPDLIMCSYNVVKNGVSEKIILPIKEGMFNDIETIKYNYTYKLLEENNKNLPSFLWLRCLKKSLIKNDYFISERLCYTEDLLFNLLYVTKIKKIYFMQKNLYYYNVNTTSLTNKYRKNMWEMLKYRFTWVKNYCDENNYTKDLSTCLSFLLWNSIVLSFNNSTKVKSFYKVRKEMNKIRTDQVTSSFFSKKNKFKSRSDKFKYFLIKNKLFFIYFFVKKIINKSEVF